MKTKKHLVLLLLLLLTISCQITEAIRLHPDGSGIIEIKKHREEQSYMQLVGENYSTEDKFVDSAYVFSDYITKYAEDFSKLPAVEKAIFRKYKDVEVHVKKNTYDKEFRTTITQKFNKIESVPDLYKTENYADDLKYNYALSAEEHYYKVSYSFDGTTFKRLVVITDSVELKKQQVEITALRTRFSNFKLTQSYVLHYYFPRKIKSVSNPKAILSDDKKGVTLQFLITDCLYDPELTNLEIVLVN